MIHRRSPLRAAMAGIMAAVVLGLAVGVPLLDAAPRVQRVAVADADAAGSLTHDHGICLVYAATPWLPAPDAMPPRAFAVDATAAAPAPSERLVVPTTPVHLPRAPPVA